jgi:hypothetical protein
VPDNINKHKTLITNSFYNLSLIIEVY